MADTLQADDMHHIAKLAKLSVSENELSEVADKLNKILELNNKISATDTSSVEPLCHPLEQLQPMREDEVSKTNQRELFQSIAPLAKHGLYLVPQVIETEE